MTVLPPTHNDTQALLSWLLDRREGVVKPDQMDGSIMLSFGRTYQATVATVFALATVMWVFIVVVFSGETATAIALGAGFGLLWIATLYGVYDAWTIRISVYRNGLKSFADLVSSNIGRSPARFTPPKFYVHTG
jgi:hypothetical protein